MSRNHTQGEIIMFKSLAFALAVSSFIATGCVDNDDDGDDCITSCDDARADCALDCDDNQCELDCDAERDDCETDCD